MYAGHEREEKCIQVFVRTPEEKRAVIRSWCRSEKVDWIHLVQDT
jgi:hypothetical protein